MTTDQLDDLELLSAANPVRAEDAVAEAEAARALFERVLATPAEAVEPPHRSRRRTGFVALAAAVVGLTVAVVLTSLPDGSPSIADRAYAAVSKPTLYHVVVRSTIDAPAFFQRELDLPRGVEVMPLLRDRPCPLCPRSTAGDRPPRGHRSRAYLGVVRRAVFGDPHDRRAVNRVQRSIGAAGGSGGARLASPRGPRAA